MGKIAEEHTKYQQLTLIPLYNKKWVSKMRYTC